MNNLDIWAFHGPGVIVQKGWTIECDETSKKVSAAIADAGSKSPPNNTFVFINTADNRRDVKARKAVRSQAMKHFSKAKKQKKLEIIKRSPISYSLETFSFGYGFPSGMKASERHLFNHYMSSITSVVFPMDKLLNSNPLKSSQWLHFASSDEATLHAVLHTAALSLPNNSVIAEEQLQKTVAKINSRLVDAFISDATICAVSCLALNAAVYSGQDSFNTHMRGLAEMIRMRGMEDLGPSLQLKLYRTDLVGACKFGQVPYLVFSRGQSTEQAPYRPTSKNFFDLDMSPKLGQIFEELDATSLAVELAMKQKVTFHPSDFLEDVFSIEHKLLGCSYSGIDEACRLAAILYLKFTIGDAPALAFEEQLRSILECICPYNDTLLLWISFVGSMSSTTYRAWFASYMLKTAILSDLYAWDGVKEVLKRVLWVEGVHGSVGEKLWAEAVMSVP